MSSRDCLLEISTILSKITRYSGIFSHSSMSGGEIQLDLAATLLGDARYPDPSLYKMLTMICCRPANYSSLLPRGDTNQRRLSPPPFST